MKRTILLCTVSLFLAGPADAQGFISKMTKAVKKTVQTLQGSEEEDKKEEKKEQNGDDQDRPTKFLPKSNFFSLDYEECKKKFANFKMTDSTQIIQLDDLSGIELGYFSNNRAFVHTSRNGIYCIDEHGNQLKKFEKGGWGDNNKVTEKTIFNSNRVIVKEGYSEATIYDNYFKPVKKFQNCVGFTNFADGVAMITTTTKNKNSTVNYKTYYIDVNGNPKFNNLTTSDTNLKEDAIRGLHDGIAAFRVYNPKDYSYYWGFRDANGKIITPAKYAYVQDFCEGMAAVAVRNADNIIKWGFIDKTGKEVIPLQYTKEPTMFDSCGLSMVTNKEGKNLFIDKTGKIVSEAFGGQSFESTNWITPFCNGKAILKSTDRSILNDYTGSSVHNIHFLVDSTFNKLCILDNYNHLRLGLMWDAIPAYTESGMPAYGGESKYEKYAVANRYADYKHSVLIHNHQMYIRIAEYSKTFGYGLLSADGDLLIAGLAGYFQEGLAPVNDESLGVGYVNEKGEWVVKFEKNEF